MRENVCEGRLCTADSSPVLHRIQSIQGTSPSILGEIKIFLKGMRKSENCVLSLLLISRQTANRTSKRSFLKALVPFSFPTAAAGRGM